jgi:predicted GNAT family N-acyltransferase
MALRHRVFCEEQGVPPELERDEHDDGALHLVAVDETGAVVGTCRLLARGERMALGRMAVDRSRRGRGVGGELLRAAHREALAAGAQEVELHAQLGALDFYSAAGYAAEGPEFEDAGIAHVLMRRRLP